MFGKAFSSDNCFSKDAFSNAPSVVFAQNSTSMYDNVVITGIAVAVSVFVFLLIPVLMNIFSFFNVIIASIFMFGFIRVASYYPIMTNIKNSKRSRVQLI